jgi:hypothetical protein
VTGMHRLAIVGSSVLVSLFAVGCDQVTGNVEGDPSRQSGSAAQEADPTRQPESPAGSTETTTPQLGISYPFRLLTHCGVATTRFGDQYWQARHPEPEPSRLPGPDGVVTYDGHTSGSMTLVNSGLLRFLIDDPLSEADGKTVEFVPLTGPAPAPCE